MISSTKNIDIPVVIQKDYQLISIDTKTNSVTYLNDKGESISDLKMPDFCDSDFKLSKELLEKFNSLEKLREEDNNLTDEIYITVLSAVGIDAIKGYKNVK